jgi:hypothetical protein
VKITHSAGDFVVKTQDDYRSKPSRRVQLSGICQTTADGPSHAGKSAMTRIAYSESESGNVVRTAIVPANRSEEAKFGPLDRTVIVVILACFLLCVAGLIYYPMTH